MAGSWQPVNLEYLVDGRRVPVSSVKYGQGGSWVTTDSVKVGTDATDPGPDPDPGTGLPAAPSGYTSFYEVDFRNIGASLPANWVAQNSTGTNNNGSRWRDTNVAVVPGVGLVHTAERASVGATIYSGTVFGRIAVPMYSHIRFRAYVTSFREGIWPSFWMRPQNSHEGEIDLLEMFGGHLNPNQSRGDRVVGGGFIATPYPDKGHLHWDFDPILGVPDPSNDWVASLEQPHTYELRITPGQAEMWCDKTSAGVRTASSMNTGSSLYNAQFNNPANTWYIRTDFQIAGSDDSSVGGGTNAGTTNAGQLSADQVGKFAKWTIEWVQVFTP